MDEEFTLKFPDLNFNLNEIIIDKSTVEKIHEYLQNDIEEQDLLIKKLIEFEKKLDGL